jgi:hypothetical protein
MRILWGTNPLRLSWWAGPVWQRSGLSLRFRRRRGRKALHGAESGRAGGVAVRGGRAATGTPPSSSRRVRLLFSPRHTRPSLPIFPASAPRRTGQSFEGMPQGCFGSGYRWLSRSAGLRARGSKNCRGKLRGGAGQSLGSWQGAATEGGSEAWAEPVSEPKIPSKRVKPD